MLPAAGMMTTPHRPPPMMARHPNVRNWRMMQRRQRQFPRPSCVRPCSAPSRGRSCVTSSPTPRSVLVLNLPHSCIYWSGEPSPHLPEGVGGDSMCSCARPSPALASLLVKEPSSSFEGCPALPPENAAPGQNLKTRHALVPMQLARHEEPHAIPPTCMGPYTHYVMRSWMRDMFHAPDVPCPCMPRPLLHH